MLTPLAVARVIGKAAQDLCGEILKPDPDAREVRAVQYLDFTFSAATGSWTSSSGLQQIVADDTATVINRLLGPEGRQTSPPPSPGGGDSPRVVKPDVSSRVAPSPDPSKPKGVKPVFPISRPKPHSGGPSIG